MNRVIFRDAMVWDGSGAASFPADVLVEGNRIRSLARDRGQLAADGAQARLWEELGPAGLHQLSGATAQRVGADLALFVTHAQRIPIPLPDPE